MLHKMNKEIVDADWLAEREAERTALIGALENMTNLAAQWERFNGVKDGSHPDIEAAKRLIVEARAA